MQRRARGTQPGALVLGAGLFGLASAIELRRRGWQVVVLDPGPVPHPLAASTDISKVVRLDYGPDASSTALMEEALEGWRRWNAGWPEPLFHETGVLFLTDAPLAPGTFEGDSYRVLVARGHRPRALDRREIERIAPAWSTTPYAHGYLNPEGGYAESGRVVSRLLDDARAAGIEVRVGVAVDRLLEVGSRVVGAIARGGERIEADAVVACLGAWTPHVLPWLAGPLRSHGLPVFHLRPRNEGLFRPDRFPVFCADISRTGFYGFPLGREGVVKVANHGPGRPMHPEAPERVVTDAETRHLRDFLAQSLPSLADAPLVFTRTCLYCDTWDGHFWIARDPVRRGLTVAAGDSGHAFKFAPVLGAIVADAVEGRPNALHGRFRWRPEWRPARSEEAARHQH